MLQSETEKQLVLAAKGLDNFQANNLKKMQDMQAQLDEIDRRSKTLGTGQVFGKTLSQSLKENDNIQRLVHDRKGRAIFEISGEQVTNFMSQKAILSSSTGYGYAGGGVINVERMPGIVTEARRELRIRDLLTSRPTTSPLIYFVRVNNPLAEASPQAEGSTKAENTLGFTTVSTQVQSIATFIKASKQLVEDFSELMGFLETSMPYYVNRAVERELVSGDGTGNHLNGLLTQASTFNSGLLSASAGWTRLDQILAAAAQVRIADEIPATWVALNPLDMYKIQRTKDGFGRYLLDGPQTQGHPMLWDLTPVSTNAIAPGTFLVGNGNPAAAEIRDRLTMQFDISTEDVDNFERNLISVRAECRLALVISRPQSFIAGTFATSPAGL